MVSQKLANLLTSAEFNTILGLCLIFVLNGYMNDRNHILIRSKYLFIRHS